MLGSMLMRVFEGDNVVGWSKSDLDITSLLDVREKLSKLQPEIVLNASAYTDVDGAEDHREEAFAVNETGIQNLAQVAHEQNCLLVHYSTDYVFPGDTKSGYAESDPPGPSVNVYGESKLAGERALVETSARFYLIRTAWLYGPNGKNFVDTMLTLAKKQKEMKVVDDQFGNPTYTKDVSQFTRILLEGNYEQGIYHAVNHGMTSWYSYAQQVFLESAAGVVVKPISSESFISPARRPQYSILLNTKGPPMRGWKEALHEYIHERAERY